MRSISTVQIWQETTLGAHVDLLTGFPFKSADYSADDADIRLLRGDNIAQGRLRWDGVKRWPQHMGYDYSEYRLRDGDVVLAMDRPWIEAGLKFAAITRYDLPALLVQRVARLRGTKSLDTTFLKYLIASRKFTEHVLAVQTGTGVPHISAEQIKSFQFLLPPVAQQKAVAAILSALDGKIELNRRMNATLEAAASAIFSGMFGDTEADEEEIPFGEIAGISREAINPGNAPAEVFEHYSIPAFDEERQPTRETGELIRSNKFIVFRDCVLLSKLNPRIPRVWLPAISRDLRSICSTEFLVLRPKPGYSREFIYGLCNSSGFREIFTTMVTGTSGSHQRVKPEYLDNMPIRRPDSAGVEKFTDIVRPLHARVAHNLRGKITLASLRDTLLPKLISGEIRLNDSERTVGAAI